MKNLKTSLYGCISSKSNIIAKKNQGFKINIATAILAVFSIFFLASCSNTSDSGNSPTKNGKVLTIASYNNLPNGRNFWWFSNIPQDSAKSVLISASPEDQSWFWTKKTAKRN